MSDIWLAEGRGGLTRVTPNQPLQRTGARDARTRPPTATLGCRMFAVREAGSNDAEAAVAAVRQSIAESCIADHRSDANTIEKWLLNKTVPHFLSWIANPDNFCVVAVENGTVQGVGLLRRVGEIVLLYLRPLAQRNGMGKAIYTELEKKAVEWGLREVTLESTDLARPFYEHLGFRSAGP